MQWFVRPCGCQYQRLVGIRSSQRQEPTSRVKHRCSRMACNQLAPTAVRKRIRNVYVQVCETVVGFPGSLGGQLETVSRSFAPSRAELSGPTRSNHISRQYG